MVALSIPPGTSQAAFVNQLRREAEENIPESVHNLISQQMIIVQYEKGVSKKKERDVVMDLARVLPGIEPLVYVWKLSTLRNQHQRFTVFLSDFDEIPLAKVLRTHYKTLSKALSAKARSIRYLTNFACRGVDLQEKMPVADLVTGYTLPFEGASLVLERDRELINVYEAEYEEAARLYREEQSKLAPPVSIKEAITTDRTAAKDLTDQEEGPAAGSGAKLDEEIEQDEVSQVGCEEEESTSSKGQKRKRGKEAEEDQAGASNSDSSSASASSSSQRSKKRRRASESGLDPITTNDRDQWILHVAVESQDVHGSSDLLKEFLTMTGANRGWTVQQWEIYLKEHKSYITQQVGKLQRELLE
ncbi:hypothetical protein FRC01_007683 [Tulasnella sp. 417]|nr:hypothetical protein FRC01_007683 [Tulasnella sp. 417]